MEAVFTASALGTLIEVQLEFFGCARRCDMPVEL